MGQDDDDDIRQLRKPDHGRRRNMGNQMVFPDKVTERKKTIGIIDIKYV